VVAQIDNRQENLMNLILSETRTVTFFVVQSFTN